MTASNSIMKTGLAASVKEAWRKVPIGTRTLLVGTHNPLVHTFVIAEAWRRLYGFTLDPRLWTAFLVHDLGYWGKKNIDGEEGEKHPILGASIMHKLFDDKQPNESFVYNDFCLYHSRFYAKRTAELMGEGHEAKDFISPLCYADKLAICILPKKVWMFLARLSGELVEYLDESANGKYSHERSYSKDQDTWYDQMTSYVLQVVESRPREDWREYLKRVA